MCLSIRHLTDGAHIRIILIHIIIRTVRGITAAAGTGMTTGIGTTGTGTTDIIGIILDLIMIGIRTGTIIMAHPMPIEASILRTQVHRPEALERVREYILQARLLRLHLQREALLLHLIIGLCRPEALRIHRAAPVLLTEGLLLQAVPLARLIEVQAVRREVRREPHAVRQEAREVHLTAAAEVHREVVGRF